MMRFVDLNNGSVYNGSSPYIHWFEENQSVNLNYVKKLCIACECDIIDIVLPDNDVFTLLDMSKLSDVDSSNINDFTYKNIDDFKTNNIQSAGLLYNLDDQHVYLHMIYILAGSSQEGEFLEDLYINDEKFIIGSSFYSKYEPHKINLANLGVEIPESITRAIYNSNVHEENIDNALINRKYKELLNEYWGVVANKGSYKSLYNALSWFEYGDLVRMQELWKNKDNYIQQDITPYINEKISSYLSNSKKTTYLGLYASLQQLFRDEDGSVVYSNMIDSINSQFDNEENLFTHAILSQPIEDGDSMNQIFIIGNDNVNVSEDYNDEDFNYFDHSDWIKVDLSNYEGFIREENPEIMSACTKWSNEDLSLKMYLLGNFFETYFMPIHLDLIHSTIENMVFTNTIKILYNCGVSRVDEVNRFFTFKCNIHNGDVFFLDNVNTQTGPDTITGIQWTTDVTKYEDMPILGVEKSIFKLYDEDDHLKTFMSQYYNGIGQVINVVCEVDINKDDFIKEMCVILTSSNGKTINNRFKLLKHQQDSKNIKFSILCKTEGDYKMDLDFITADQCNYVKTVKFSILDNTNKDIKIYKVKYNTLEEHKDVTKYPEVGNYIYSQYRNSETPNINKFYLPKNISGDGVVLNRTIIIRGDVRIEEIILDDYTRLNTQVLKKYKIENMEITDEITYTIFILPVNGKVEEDNIKTLSLIRDDYVFYPEKHHLEEIATGDNVTIDDYTFNQYDVLMVVPETKYLKEIDDYEWEFVNISKLDSTPIKLKSIQTPFVANSDYKLLDPGFYNIKFRYKLGQIIQEMTLDSAFRIV